MSVVPREPRSGQPGHPVFHFSEAFRSALCERGVSPAQLHALEEVLPRCRTALRPEPRMAELRKEAQRLHAVVDAAWLACQRVDAADESNPALDALLTQLQLKRGHLSDTINRLTTLGTALDRVIRDLPGEQTRKVAVWEPVRLIHLALQEGWAAKSLDPLPISVTATQGGDFRTIVGLCYDAMLESQDEDPEKAIRAYVSHLKKIDASPLQSRA